MITGRTHLDDFNAYVDGVMEGRITVGAMVRLAVERHVADIKRDAFDFDVKSLNRVCQFFRAMRHTTGDYAGQNFELRQFQKFIVGSIFAWKREDGTRRYRDAYVSLGRGNGKSPLGAGVGNYCAWHDNEARADVVSAATTRDQAAIVWTEASLQVENCGSASLRNRITTHKLNMSDPLTYSRFRPLGSDSKNTDGLNLHCAIQDELHEWRPRHRGLWDKINSAFGKRRQPLRLMVTTAGDDDSEIWQEQYDESRQVLEGILNDDAHFAYIAEIDDDDDPTDPAVWVKANPMLAEPDSPVQVAYLERLAEQAKANPAKLQILKRYHCNKQVVSFYRLIPSNEWSKGEGELPDLDGRECFAGFDFGWRDDLAALTLVFPMGEDQYALKSFAWIPEDCPHELHKQPWARFTQRGELRVTEGNTTDTAAIRATVEDVRARYQLKSFAADDSNARELLTWTQNDLGIETFPFYQTCRNYNAPVRDFVAAVTSGNMLHGDNQLLAWTADNLTVREDSEGRVMPSKAKSRGKIDPIVAGIMAFSEAKFSTPATWHYQTSEMDEPI